MTYDHLTVGSDRNNHLVVEAPAVAAFHVRIALLPSGKFALEQLDSHAETFLNGSRVTHAEFSLLDSVRLGTTPLPLSHRAVCGLLLRPTRAVDSAAGFSIGSAPECDIVVAHPSVAANHAFVRRSGPGVVDVYDRSGGHLSIDRRGYPIERARVLANSILWLGECPIPFATLLHRIERIDVSRTAAGTTLPFGKATLKVTDEPPGRDETDTPTTGSPRPRITLTLDAVRVEVMDRVSREQKRLVDDVTLSAMPGEMVALLGPSGAGKSTLLHALLGLTHVSGGRVLVNGRALAEVSEELRANLGYVPQDDIVHADLTVAEALRFACRLRMPPDTPDASVEDAIARTLEEVGLTPQRDSIIGSADDKVLSGGQRRRVNLAVELVTDPAVLVLDEPTSGLSWTDAADVVATLRRVADGGRTVVLTIHQPDVQEYEAFDSVAILGAGGKLLYFGPPKPDSYDFFGAQRGRPRSIFDRLDQVDSESWRARYEQSELRRRYFAEWQSAALRPGQTVARAERPRLWHQLRTLIRRTVTLTLRQRATTLLMMAQAPLLGLLIAASATNMARVPIGTFGCLPSSDPAYFDTCVGVNDLRACDSRVATDFLMHGRERWAQLDISTQRDFDTRLSFRRTLIRDPRSVLLSLYLAIFLPMVIVSATSLVGEQTIYRRERMAGLDPRAYVAARFAVLAALGSIVSLLLLGVAVPILDLNGGFMAYLGLGAGVAAAASAQGLMLSSIVNRPASALWGVNILIVPQLLFAGTVTKLKGLTAVVSEFTATRPVIEALSRLHLASPAGRPDERLEHCQIDRWMEAMPGYHADLENPIGTAFARIGLISLISLALAIGFTARKAR